MIQLFTHINFQVQKPPPSCCPQETQPDPGASHCWGPVACTNHLHHRDSSWRCFGETLQVSIKYVTYILYIYYIIYYIYDLYDLYDYIFYIAILVIYSLYNLYIIVIFTIHGWYFHRECAVNVKWMFNECPMNTWMIFGLLAGFFEPLYLEEPKTFWSFSDEAVHHFAALRLSKELMLNAVALNAILDVDELLEYDGPFAPGLDRKNPSPWYVSAPFFRNPSEQILFF